MRTNVPARPNLRGIRQSLIAKVSLLGDRIGTEKHSLRARTLCLAGSTFQEDVILSQYM